jgi:stage III sporulation protein AB
MIENIEILLKYKNLSTKEIFRILSNNKNYYLLTFLKKIDEQFKICENDYFLNESNISNIKNNIYLDNSEKEILLEYFSLLGKSDLNGQIIHCQTYKDIFKKKLKENEVRELGDCKNSGVLIMGIGFLIVIMII